MASLNIKGFPEPLYRMLQTRARAECRSVAQEVIYLLRAAVEPAPRLSIMELQGLGKETWKGVDAADYVRRERDSWE